MQQFLDNYEEMFPLMVNWQSAWYWLVFATFKMFQLDLNYSRIKSSLNLLCEILISSIIPHFPFFDFYRLKIHPLQYCKIHRFKISCAKFQILRYLCMTFLHLQFMLTACSSTTCTLPPLQYNGLILSGAQTLNTCSPNYEAHPSPDLHCSKSITRLCCFFCRVFKRLLHSQPNKSCQDAFVYFNLGW